MKRSSAILVTAAALAAVTAVVAIRIGGWWDDDSASPQQNSALAPPTAVACAFETGERAAFSLQMNGQAQGAPDQQDLFKAVLSWEVVDSPHPGEWLLRAGFSSTELR